MSSKRPEPPSSPAVPGEKDNGYLAYVLAAATFATAFGNMFAARRLKSVPKAPRGFYKDEAGWKAGGKAAGMAGACPGSTRSSGSRAGGQSEASKTESDAHTRQRHREYHYSKEQERVMHEAHGHRGRRRRGPGALSVPASVAVHLEILQLPTSELPSRGAVAKQYRALALQHHPDRLPAGLAKDDPLRVKSEQLFKAAAHAYAQLNMWYDSHDDDS